MNKTRIIIEAVEIPNGDCSDCDLQCIDSCKEFLREMGLPHCFDNDTVFKKVKEDE